jgi:hypothetical protein
MRRPSSVNLRRLESSGGKGWWVLGWWSRQMSFMEGSSRMERELPSNGVVRQAMGKGFGIKACQSVVRAQKRIQNPPRQRRQNVIAQIVGWENPDPNHKSVTTMGVPTHCHLR